MPGREPLLRDRPVTFEADVSADLSVTTDPERLRQVLANLLVNAAKFTHVGCVRLVARAAGDAVDLTVEDTGCGIEENLVARVFEPFVRGEGPGAGSGLGLAIVARLLPMLGGQIAVDSEPGRGTRIALRLPAA